MPLECRDFCLQPGDVLRVLQQFRFDHFELDRQRFWSWFGRHRQFARVVIEGDRRWCCKHVTPNAIMTKWCPGDACDTEHEFVLLRVSPYRHVGLEQVRVHPPDLSTFTFQCGPVLPSTAPRVVGCLDVRMVLEVHLWYFTICLG